MTAELTREIVEYKPDFPWWASQLLDMRQLSVELLSKNSRYTYTVQLLSTIY
jgi:hypothetical protein